MIAAPPIPYLDDYSDNRMKLLVVSNVSLLNGSKLREFLFVNRVNLDCIILCGPLVTPAELIQLGGAAGHSLSIVTNFEVLSNVVYCLGEIDYFDYIHPGLQHQGRNVFSITPNSFNVTADKNVINKNMYIAGYSEGRFNKKAYDFLATINDENDITAFKKRIVKNTVNDIKKVLIEGTLHKNNNSYGQLSEHGMKIKEDIATASNGIFIFDYKSVESLTEFMIDSDIPKTGIKLLIVPLNNNDNNDNKDLLCKTCADDETTILFAPSFNATGKYNIVYMQETDNKWKVVEVVEQSLEL